jgi:peroxiredoxin
MIVRRMLPWIGALLLVVAALAPAAAAEMALCVVCAAREGATEPEPVKAWRTHNGTRYGFCSEGCARAFDAEPAAYLPAALPRVAPELNVASLAGAPLAWKDFAGRVVLVDFWATWCAPCRKSMPELQALHVKHAARGFTVLGVSIDERKDAAKVKKFASQRGITYPIALDTASAPAWERFGVKAVPAAFLVDRDGRIVAEWRGRAPLPAEIEQELEKLLAAD